MKDSSLPTSKHRLPWQFVLLFLLFAIGIITIAIYYYQQQKEVITQETKNALTSIADIKVQEISNWRKERLGNVNIIAENHYLAQFVDEFCYQHLKPEQYILRKNSILHWMKALHTSYSLDAIFLFDTTGRVAVEYNPKGEKIDSFTYYCAKQTFQTKTVFFSDVYDVYKPGSGDIDINLCVPLRTNDSSDAIYTGVIVLRIEVEKTLFSLLQSWPIQSKSMETILLRREGNEVVYLNELRQMKNTALNFRFPITDSLLPAAKAAQGYMGIIEGNDYRHVAVLAATRTIPNSPWFLVVKEDIEEIYAPIKKLAFIITFFTGFFVIVIGIELLFFWRHQKSRFYKTLYENESEKNALLHKYEFLTKYANDSIFLTDDRYRIVEVNEHACEMYQYTQEEFLKLTIYDLRTPEEAKLIPEQVEKLKIKNGLVYETKHRKKDGLIFPVEVSNRMIEIDGKTFFQAIVRDIADRKNNEQQILKLNRLYVTLGQINEAIVRTASKDQLFKDICRIAVEYGQFQLAWIGNVDVSAKSIIPIVHYGSNNISLEGIASYMEGIFDRDIPTMQAIRLKKCIVSSDLLSDPKLKDWHEAVAEYGIHSYAAVPILLGGNVIAVLNVFASEQDFIDKEEIHLLEEIGEDVSFAMERFEFIEQQNLLQEQLMKLQQAVATSGEIIFITDMDGNFQYVNPAFTRLYGYSPEDVLGKATPRLLKSGKQTQELYVNFWQTLLGKHVFKGELINKTKEGKLLNVEVSVSPIVGSLNEVLGFLAIQRDVTERKQIEEQYYRSQRLESLGTLAGGIAHDLNNVLAPIMLAVELLKKQYQGGHNQSVIETLERSAVRGKGIIQQILTFARGTDGERAELQPKYVIKEIEKIIQETFPRSIECRDEIDRNLKMVVGDVTQLHQVLLNLCVNARDAMPNGGRLTLKAENRIIDESYLQLHIDANPGSYVVLSVCDTGTGMTQEIQGKIFDPFFTTKERGKGTGLGLATVHSIVKSHGGFITVQSEPEKGSVFSVYLPAVIHSQDFGARAHEENLPVGHGEHILVVDDEASVRDITKQTLELFGYKVSQASDGTEAIAIYAKNRSSIDVVLTDIMMPIMDGYATMRALKKINPELIVIAASGLVADQEIIETTIGKIEAFIQKPFTPAKLLITLDDLLSKRKEKQNENYL